MPASLPPAQRASKGRHPFLARDSLSECYFASKGAAHVLSSGGGLGIGAGAAVAGGRARRTPAPAPAGSSDIQLHLQSMFYLLRPEETLKMAVKLESVHAQRTRYLVVVSRASCDAAGNLAGEEACLLGIDCNRRTTVGLVLRVLGDTAITLDGDGGFSVSVCQRPHIFKPVSVQAMWSALQTLHRVSSRAREQNFFQGGASHDWVGYYEEQIESERSCLNEWFAMDSIESRRPPSPDSVRTKPREREETERVIRSTLKEIMMSVDLDEVTSKVIRGRLEEDLDMDLGEFKPFIDQEMITILGQMDSPTEIFDHVYLGSEWNASNLEELQKNGVRHILNVTREIDNFFPGMFDYLNIRVYDDEKTDLLRYWDNTFKYIERARKENSKVLVHCKMGVSRSASVVIAYAMKALDWSFDKAMKHVKEKRSCIKPNSSFLGQLETYQGILDAMKNKEKLQRSKSETNLKSPGLVSKTDSRNRFTEPTPFLLAASGRCRGRPRSWSPDTRLASRLLPPTSVSLEHLGPETRNKLMPCANGSYSVSQNQIMRLREDGVPSVKHIVNDFESHAAAIENETQRVKRNLKLNLANQIDSLKFTLGDAYSDARDKSGSKSSEIGDVNFQYDPVADDFDIMGNVIQSKDSTDNTEIWDPGENGSEDGRRSDGGDLVDDKNLNEIVKCDSGIVDTRPIPRQSGDPFSKMLDRVFDKEERRRGSGEGQRTEGGGPPSRQGSFSSCDSAVVCERVSRHSSWGSYDTRPSRNSSCGSYDETWNTGTVKRTKQKLEESSAKRICADSDPPGDGIEEAVNSILVHKMSAPLCDLDIINENHEQLDSVNSNKTFKRPDGAPAGAGHPERDNKMSAILKELDFSGGDVAGDVSKRNGGFHSRLSASAPVTSCMNFMERGPSPHSSGSVGDLFSPKIANRGIALEIEPLGSGKCKSDILKTGNPAAITRTLSGKVKNLKMEFEAKSNVNGDNKSAFGNETALLSANSASNNNNGKGRSLPSSPVSVHVDKQQRAEPEPAADPPGHASSLEDLSVKVLVGKYDRPKSQQFSAKTAVEPPVPLRKSSLHRDIDDRAQREQSAPAVRNSIFGGSRPLLIARRPPVPPGVAPVGFPADVVATVVAKAQTKKQIQHGKTHPLARLKNPTANRCTNPVYNTM